MSGKNAKRIKRDIDKMQARFARHVQQERFPWMSFTGGPRSAYKPVSFIPIPGVHRVELEDVPVPDEDPFAERMDIPHTVVRAAIGGQLPAVREADARQYCFADESCWNVGRFRAVAAVSLAPDLREPISTAWRAHIEATGVRELKWQDLKNTYKGDVADLLVWEALFLAYHGKMRIDVLAWDNELPCFQQRGSNDTQILAAMYERLFIDILQHRWFDHPNSWRIHPDQQTGVDWTAMCHAIRSLEPLEQEVPFEDTVYFIDREPPDLRGIEPRPSQSEPLIQVADLFAGLSCYARKNYRRFEAWMAPLPGEPYESFSNSEKRRLCLLGRLLSASEHFNLGITLDAEHGLMTATPGSPLRFYWFEPSVAESPEVV